MRTLARGRRPREAGVHCGSSCRSRAEGKAAVKRLLLALLILSSLLGALPAWAEEPAPRARKPSEARAADSQAKSPQKKAPGAVPPRSAEADPAPPADAKAGEGAVDGTEFRVRLRELEQKVEELKEQVRQSHARLSLLSDTILAGGQGGGRVEIRFENELSAAWHIVEITVVFDGAVQYKKADESGALSAQKKTPIFSGAVPAGDHTLQVLIKLRGHGFGVFSYLRGIEAEVRHDHSFSLTQGQDVEVVAVAWEQGGPTTPAEKRPDVRFHEVMHKASAKAAAEKARGTTRSRKKGKAAAPEASGKE